MDLIDGSDIRRLVASDGEFEVMRDKDDYLESMRELGIDGESVINQLHEMVPDLIDVFVDDGEPAVPAHVGLLAMTSGFEMGFRLALKKERLNGEQS